MKHTRESIAAEVMEVVKLVRGVNVKTPPLTMAARLVKDLHMEHDTGDLVLLLQKRTNIKPPSHCWKDAITIGDVVELLLKYSADIGA